MHTAGEIEVVRLDHPVNVLSGIGPKRLEVLTAAGIRTVRDLLAHLPRDYSDRRFITPIAEVKPGEKVTVRGEVVRSKNRRLRRGLTLAEVTVRDETGVLKAHWFGRGFLANALVPDTELLLTGEAIEKEGLSLRNPDYEVLKDEADGTAEAGGILPIYPLTEGLSQRLLRRWMREALERLPDEVPETLPQFVLDKHGFPPLRETLRHVHFPNAPEQAERARRRFAYEKLFRLQTAVVAERGRRMHAEAVRHVTHGPRLEQLGRLLPFALTAAQQRAIAEILRDMTGPFPMARLLHGDVGSGKTAVALHAIAAALDGGHQAALMAPTEALAEQHFLGLRPILASLGVKLALLTGAVVDARGLRRDIARGTVQLVIGTQALIQEKTEFHNLGLVVIDEQHRFGVMQRARLTRKGPMPDALHLSATPIPRTLAMTLYGAMDLSVLDELPPGRRPVKTGRVPASKLDGLYEYVIEQARRGFQTYYICPLIEGSDSTDLGAVVQRYDSLREGPWRGLRVGLLHGRLARDAKEAAMAAFKGRQLDVLVSTSVIEVGIDAPFATTMIIEDAAQFGLTQLHQLRGRVGRGTEQSYCFLLGKPKTDEGRRRLEILCQCADGFKIAEEDLKLRGPGQIQGLRQAGFSDATAEWLHDPWWLAEARRDAERWSASTSERGYDAAESTGTWIQ